MNHKVVIKSSCIIINDYTFGECPKIEGYFKLYDMVTHSFYYLGLYYDEENRRLFLPRGMDIWYILKCFDIEEPYFEECDEFDYIDEIRMKYQPRDDIQKECLRFMLGTSEYKDNRDFSQLSVNLSTGKGKSFVSIYTIAYEKIKSIIITYSNGWLEQWRDYILEYTNLKKKDIYWISGSKSISMLLSGKSKFKDSKIFLVTHATIKSYAEQYGWDKITELFKILKIGFKFIDEAHLNFLNISMIDFYTNVFRTFYITATPARSDEYENRVYQLYKKNVPSIDLFDEDNDPHTEYIAIKWNSRPNPQQLKDCRNIYGLDRNKYTNYVVNQPNFKLMLHIIMELVIKCNGRCLFYIGTNEAILKVYYWINDNYPEFIGDVGIYTTLVGENKNEEKQKKLILSTTKSAGAAEHIEGLKMTIVLAEPFKSEVIAQQSLGRTRDNNTFYIELVDLAFNKIKQYYYAKLPTFNKYATSTSDMNIGQEELENKAYDIYMKRKRMMCLNPLKIVDDRFDRPDSHLVNMSDKKKEPLIFFDR